MAFRLHRKLSAAGARLSCGARLSGARWNPVTPGGESFSLVSMIILGSIFACLTLGVALHLVLG